jgi:hypothetical protein
MGGWYPLLSITVEGKHGNCSTDVVGFHVTCVIFFPIVIKLEISPEIVVTTAPLPTNFTKIPRVEIELFSTD